MSRRHPILASLAVVGVTAVVATCIMPAAYAAEGEPVITNRETVQAYLDATGDLKVARIYDQLAAFGNGTVTVENPVSGKGLRNLNGFGGVDVEDGNAMQKLEVDGEARLRTLSDFEGDLPVDVIVAYSLNGKSVKPSDIVGKSGLVEVHYTVKNVTGEMREITYTNGAGGQDQRVRRGAHSAGGVAQHNASVGLHQCAFGRGRSCRRWPRRHEAVVHHDVVPAHRQRHDRVRVRRTGRGRRASAGGCEHRACAAAAEPVVQGRCGFVQGRCRVGR